MGVQGSTGKAHGAARFAAGLVAGVLVLPVALAVSRPAAGQDATPAPTTSEPAGPTVQPATGPVDDALDTAVEAAAAGVAVTAAPADTVGDPVSLQVDVPSSIELPSVLALDFVPPPDPDTSRHQLADPPDRTDSVPVPSGCDLLIELGYAREPESRQEDSQAKSCPSTLAEGDGSADLLSTDDPPGSILDFARDPMVNIDPELSELLHQQLQTLHTEDVAALHSLLQDQLDGFETLLDDALLVSQLPPTAAVQACATIDVVHGSSEYTLAGDGTGPCGDNGMLLRPGVPVTVPVVPGLADDIAPAAFHPRMLQSGGAQQVATAGHVDDVTVTANITLTVSVPGLGTTDHTVQRSLSVAVPQVPIPPMGFGFGGQDFGPRDDWYLLYAAVPTDAVFGDHGDVISTVQDLLSLAARVRGTVDTLEGLAGFVAPGWVTEVTGTLGRVVEAAPLGGSIDWAGVAFSRGDRADLDNDLLRNCSEGAHGALQPSDIYCGGVDRRSASDDVGLNDELYSAITLGRARTWCWYEDDDFSGATGALAPNTPAADPVLSVHPDVSRSLGAEFTPSGVGTAADTDRPDGNSLETDDGMSSFRWVSGSSCP